MDREPRAVLLLLSLAAAGQLVRAVLASPGNPPGAVLREGAAGDPLAHKNRAERLAAPLKPGERIDLNRAAAEEIARLPRIGMSLAKRIVEARTARGRFEGLDDLDRVPGVGPGLLTLVRDRVTFGAGEPVSILGPEDANLSIGGAYEQVPGGAPGGPVDLNSASEADLVALPGIGRGRALAILAYRRSHGSFAAVSDLERVPGLSRSVVARLLGRVEVR